MMGLYLIRVISLGLCLLSSRRGCFITRLGFGGEVACVGGVQRVRHVHIGQSGQGWIAEIFVYPS